MIVNSIRGVLVCIHISMCVCARARACMLAYAANTHKVCLFICLFALGGQPELAGLLGFLFSIFFSFLY